jgi:peptidoglycan/xylan/chitin deacetylase (PgdA/CDA1 family)
MPSTNPAHVLKRWVRRTGLRRAHIAYARLCCERHLLALPQRRLDRPIGRILCYHTVGQPEWGVNDVSPAQLRRHIELALRAGLRFVPASEIARTGGESRDIAVTFDDGLRSTLTKAAPILAEYGVPWSLFVVSDWADGRSAWGHDTVLGWREIETLMKQGVELGSHSVSHPDFSTLEPSQIVDELGDSRRTIEARLGIAPTSFAIPFGQSKNWTALASEAACDTGYELVYAQAEETRPAGTIPRTFVTRVDGDTIFKALLRGAYDRWEEWY